MAALLRAFVNRKEKVSRTQIVPDVKINAFREGALHGTRGEAEFGAAVRSTCDTMLQPRNIIEPSP